MYEKFNFSVFVVKAAKSHVAWFCSLLQIFWAAEKAQWFIPMGPWFLRWWYLYFCCVVWYRYLTRKKVIYITTNKNKPICGVKTDFVRCILSASKYMNKIKIPTVQKPGACGNEYLLFFLLPKRFAVNWRTRQNATRQFLSQNSFFAHILIARICYYSYNEL